MNSDFSNIALEEQELITEWTVDPKKKSKLIDIALHKFRSECKKSKNAYIKNRVYIFNENELKSANKNFLFKGGIRENKYVIYLLAATIFIRGQKMLKILIQN